MYSFQQAALLPDTTPTYRNCNESPTFSIDQARLARGVSFIPPSECGRFCRGGWAWCSERHVRQSIGASHLAAYVAAYYSNKHPFFSLREAETLTLTTLIGGKGR